MEIGVGARPSELSRVQLSEVWQELRLHHPYVVFIPSWTSTTGDLDRSTPLSQVNQSDFFTREIDQQLLRGDVRVAIHSAKDLPCPLPEGLYIVALTKGVDSRDALVMPHGKTLATLRSSAKIGCSSKRRESVIKNLRMDFVPTDIRGTILERLQQMEDQKIDALLMAVAAIIRLRLLVNHLILEHDTEPGQGRLAVIARKDDLEMEQLFSCINQP